MNREMIKRIASKAELPVPLTEYVLKRSGAYMKVHMKETNIARFLIKGLGTWAVNLNKVNWTLRNMEQPRKSS